MVPLAEVAETLTVTAPRAAPEARPVEPTVTLDASEDNHVADEVRLAVVPSLYLPRAENCTESPTAIPGPTGVKSMELSSATTLIIWLPLTAPRLAVIVTEPPLTADTRPPLLTVASTDEDELQVAVEVTSFDDPSL